MNAVIPCDNNRAERPTILRKIMRHKHRDLILLLTVAACFGILLIVSIIG